MNDARVLPSTAQDLINALLAQDQWTVDRIAQVVSVSKRTIHRLHQGSSALPETKMQLTMLYLIHVMYQESQMGSESVKHRDGVINMS